LEKLELRTVSGLSWIWQKKKVYAAVIGSESAVPLNTRTNMGFSRIDDSVTQYSIM